MSFRTMYKTLSTDNVLQINWIRQMAIPANSSESRRCQLTTKCTLQQHAHIHISPVSSTPPKKKQGGTLSWNHVRRTGTQFSPRGRGQYSPGTQPQGVQTRGCDRGCISPPRRRPQECGQHRQRGTDRGKSSQCNQRDAASAIRSEDFGLCGRTVKRTAQWAVRR